MPAYSPGYEALAAKLHRHESVVLDGAVATELQARGARGFHLSDSDHWGFEALHHMPQAVSDVHASYLQAGCDVVTTNTYSILDVTAPGALSQSPQPLHWMDLTRTATRLAHEAIAQTGSSAAVAFSIGGDAMSDDHLRTVQLLLRCFEDSVPDLVMFETLSMMQDSRTREAIKLLMDAGYPVWVSFRRCREGVCGIHGQLWGGPEGDYFGRLAAELQELGVGALLINCLPAFRVEGTLQWLADFTDLPLGVYPNLGRYVDPQWRFDEHTTPDGYVTQALAWHDEGARILGGCCGVRPAHIAALAQALDGKAVPHAKSKKARVSPARARRSEPVQPWEDQEGRPVFPLPLPEIRCEPDVFVPTQGSYLVWKYLLNQRIGQGQRCLDVGCGAGLLSIQLALNGATRVVAMDIEKAAVANTLTNAFRNGVDKIIRGEVADLYTLEAKHMYDVIVASLYQMPTDPKGELSGHRPVDYWGRNLLDYFISMLPDLLAADGVAYIMQISLLGQEETARQLRAEGFKSRVLDYNLYRFTPVFLENLEQIERVEQASDAYHFSYRDRHVMVMYLIEVTRE